jgi:ligand-binding sensor domain-containing protein
MRISAVTVTSTGKLWIGTYDEGFYVDEGAGLIHTSTGFNVYAIEEDKNGNIWLGSDFGLAKWNGYAWEYINDTRNLPAGSVTALLSDSKDRMWIGIYGKNKIYRINNSKLDSLTLMNGPFGNEIWDICEDQKGDIWFATYWDGLIRYDGVVPHAYKEYNVIDGNGDNIIEDFVNCIEVDKDGNMWFGLYSKGLIKYTLPLY